MAAGSVEAMIGQRILPERWYPLAEQMPDADLRQFMAGVKDVIARCVDAMPPHQTFIERHCKAG